MNLSRYLRYIARSATDSWHSRQHRQIDAKAARGVIVSFYMPNISYEVVEAQRRVLEAFSPPDVSIRQVLTRRRHGAAMTNFMRATSYRCVLFLDIDCVPARQGAIEAMFERAERGCLVGAAQRANHIDNNEHLYAAPFCLALTRTAYDALGRPSFVETSRGDVGEELTYIAEERGIPVELSLPIASDDHQWVLTDGVRFGSNTYYDSGFFHAFQIRMLRHQADFVAKCEDILGRRSGSVNLVSEVA